jgi:26S proteasome regulatory subunit N5
MIDQRIPQDCDYILLVEKEKIARLDNEISEGAELCVQIVNLNLIKYINHNYKHYILILFIFEFIKIQVNLVWSKYGIECIPAVFASLSKKRNQSKKTQTEMIKTILEQIYPTCQKQEERVKVLKSIIEITEGKIYVEYEYSVAIKKLTEIMLSQGDIEEAARLIQDIQIETFGSLDKVYKVEYILFQLLVLIQKGDFIRFQIVSNKVKRKHLDDKELYNLKIKFYFLMIKFYIHEERYFEAANCYQILYEFYTYLYADNNKNLDTNNTELIESLSKMQAVDLFQRSIYLYNISPPDEKTKEKIQEIKKKYYKELETWSATGNLINIKTGDDLVTMEESFLNSFENPIFKDDSEFFINGKKNSDLFRKYIIQYNITLFHKFYNQVSLERIAELIKVNKQEVESEICHMVMNEFIYAKINRIKGIVGFRPKQTFETKSDSLNKDLTKMLETLETTCHLIHKENLKYGIKD